MVQGSGRTNVRPGARLGINLDGISGQNWFGSKERSRNIPRKYVYPKIFPSSTGNKLRGDYIRASTTLMPSDHSSTTARPSQTSLRGIYSTKSFLVQLVAMYPPISCGSDTLKIV